MCQKCVTEKTAAKIELVESITADWSGGAWWAFVEEQGLDADDLAAYWDEHKEKKDETINSKTA